MMSDRRRLASVLAIAGGMFLTAAAQAQTTWYVDNANCPGPGSGSERDPFCKIQDGIDASSTGDTVIVADGTYTGIGNRDLDFGGRDIHLRSESLDPELCIIDCQGSEANPHRGFYFHNGETSDAVMDGFTITNGYAFSDSQSMRAGGAILCHDFAGPTIKNCILSGNSATQPKGGATVGGAIAGLGGRLTIIDCTITQNEVWSVGGGVYCFGSLTMRGCTISGNSTVHENNGKGGGVYVHTDDEGTVIIENCTISGNSSTRWGGGLMWQFSSSSLTLRDCTISGNTLNNDSSLGASGGGIRVSGNATISNCVFTGNSANALQSAGGAMALGGSSGGIAVTNCTVLDNMTSGFGGGISCSGDVLVSNSVLIGNEAGENGGGMWCRWGSPQMVNCTVADNMAGLHGGAFACLGSSSGTSPAIHNSILWSNTAPQGRELAVLDYYDGYNWFPAELTVTHSDAQGGQPAVHVDPLSTLNWLAGNIYDDPLFIDPVNGDFHITAASLVIDAADNEAVPPDSADLDDDGDTDEPTPFDLDGYARIVDGDGDEEADVDMGAYEFQTEVPCPWDLNGDGEVGPFDLALVLGFWGPCEEPCTPEATCTTDLDGDCATGPFDLALILGFWGPCP